MKNLTLKRPVEFDGKTYAAIVIDEPTLGAVEVFQEAEAAGKSEVAAMIEMLAVDSGWPIGAIRRIRVSDLQAITDAFSPFIGKVGKTGDPSPPT